MQNILFTKKQVEVNNPTKYLTEIAKVDNGIVKGTWKYSISLCFHIYIFIEVHSNSFGRWF